MPTSWNIEWLNLNSGRRYPFKEDMLLTASIDGEEQSDIVLPNYIIVDAIFILPSTAAISTKVFLGAYIFSDNYISLSFVDQDNIKIGEVTVNLLTHVKYTTYYLSSGNALYEDAVSKLVIGDLSTISQDIPKGIFTFSNDVAELESRVVRPDIRGVHAIQLLQGSALSNKLFGDVKLIAGTNMRIRYVPVTIVENGVEKACPGIRFDAISGENLNEECECDAVVKKPTCIQTINGVTPDNVGNINIIGDSCIEISDATKTESGFIMIVDNCSKPCCGCAELQYLTGNIKLLESTLDRLNATTDQVQTRIENFYLNFIQTVRP